MNGDLAGGPSPIPHLDEKPHIAGAIAFLLVLAGPIRRELLCLYPPHWRELSRRIRFERTGGRCQACGRPLGAPAALRRASGAQARHAARPPFWPANRIAKLRKLWGTLSKAAIARELGISKATVFRQARRFALPLRRRATPVPS